MDKFEIYSASDDNKYRFLLGREGANPLIVIGLNPSTADNIKSDRTITKVNGIAEGAKLDGFIMLNLYPLRSTRPDGLTADFDNEIHKMNLKEIERILYGRNNIQVLLAFGNNILLRPYLRNCFKDLYVLLSKYNPSWNKTGDLTKTGHPRHPLYVSYYHGLTDFDMEKYIDLL